MRERRPAVVCAPPVPAPSGCASCAALAARVAELEKARPPSLPDVPREVRSEIYQCAALENENLKEAVGRGRARACALPGEEGLAIGSVRCANAGSPEFPHSHRSARPIRGASSSHGGGGSNPAVTRRALVQPLWTVAFGRYHRAYGGAPFFFGIFGVFGA